MSARAQHSSFQDRIDHLVRDAVARIWPLFQTAPAPFTGYKAAERYLAQRLSSARFDYGIAANADPNHAWSVKSRVHRAFAREAETAGLFVMDRELGARPARDDGATSSMRREQTVAAANIRRLEAHISAWPTSFADLNAARRWARNVCEQKGLEFVKYSGRTPSSMRSSVVNSVVLNACNAGEFFLEDNGPGHSAMHVQRKKHDESPLRTPERRDSAPSSSPFGGYGDAAAHRDDKVPKTPPQDTSAMLDYDLIDLRSPARSVPETPKDDAAGHLEVVEQMRSGIELHAAEKSVREMGEEMEIAERKMDAMGMRIRRESVDD